MSPPQWPPRRQVSISLFEVKLGDWKARELLPACWAPSRPLGGLGWASWESAALRSGRASCTCGGRRRAGFHDRVRSGRPRGGDSFASHEGRDASRSIARLELAQERQWRRLRRLLLRPKERSGRAAAKLKKRHFASDGRVWRLGRPLASLRRHFGRRGSETKRRPRRLLTSFGRDGAKRAKRAELSRTEPN